MKSLEEVYESVYEKCRISKSIETEQISGCQGRGGGRQKWEETASWNSLGMIKVFWK